MNFKRFLNEYNEIDLVEAAGNLAGLPKSWVKEIVSWEGNGGENSQIVLFKADAKQKDLTAAIKKIGGYVKPDERASRWARSKTRAEIQAQLDKDENAGVLVKVNGEWAFFAKYNEFGSGGQSYLVWSKEGIKSVKQREEYSIGRGINKQWKSRTFDRRDLSAGELGDAVGFGQEGRKIDVYLITADAERILKAQERKAQRGEISSVSPERKAATIKFLQTKSASIVNASKQEIQEIMNKINKLVESRINRAITGEELKDNSDVEILIRELNAKMEVINAIGAHMADIVKKGNIIEKKYFSPGFEQTYAYKAFNKLISDLQKEE